MNTLRLEVPLESRHVQVCSVGPTIFMLAMLGFVIVGAPLTTQHRPAVSEVAWLPPSKGTASLHVNRIARKIQCLLFLCRLTATTSISTMPAACAA